MIMRLGLATEWIEIQDYFKQMGLDLSLGLATEWIEMANGCCYIDSCLVSVLRPSGLKWILYGFLSQKQCLGLATEWIEIS